MHINAINLNNFIGVRSLNLDITDPVLLVAGPNGSGKSTIRDAVRFGIFGTPGRVEAKRDYKSLISTGAKKGVVQISIEGNNITRDVGTGKVDSSTNIILQEDDLGFVIDADKFASLNVNEKRATLFRVMSVKKDQAAIKKRMVDQGCDEKLTDSIMIMLRSGFEAAEKDAAQQATAAKGTWKGVTGETYGIKKAEIWEAKAPEVDMEQLQKELLEHNKQLKAEEKSLDGLNKKIGEATAVTQTIDNMNTEIEEQRTLFKDGRVAPKDIEESAIQIEALKSDIQEIESQLLSLDVNVMEFICPDCAVPHRLTVIDGKIVVADTHSIGDDVHQQRVTLNETITTIKNELHEEAARQKKLDEAHAAERNVLKLLEQRNKMNGEQSEDLDALEQSVAEAKQNIEKIRLEIGENTVLQLKSTHADKTTEQAKNAHEEAVKWLKIKDALSPSGIPAELLAEAISPLNATLAEHSVTTGWKPVRIEDDMTITADGRDYALLSESEQWRCDSMIAASISKITKIGVLILDRIDVLDLPSRSVAMNWLLGLSSEFGTIMVMGTLKALPPLPSGVQGLWMGPDEMKAAA